MKISGTAAGVLPSNVPVDATWRELSRALGPLRAFALNGTVYVTLCAMPAISVLMDIPDIAAPINAAPPDIVDSVMSTSRIRTVTVSSRPKVSSPAECSR